MDVAGDAGVGAVAGLGDAAERLLEEIRGGDASGEGDGFGSKFGLRVEEDGFVDEVLGEEGSVEVGAAFEEQAEEVALGECGEDGGEAEVFGVVGDGRDFDSEFSEGGDVSCWRGRSAEDEEVVAGGADELRGERDAEVGVEDDAEEWAAAGLTVGAEDAAAVGEGGVVGEDGADAGEDSVGVVA